MGIKDKLGEKKKTKLGLAAWIIIGMLLGVLCGLFFGESCKHLKIIGDIFISLLQMTILPYIITSLILGIGSLNFHEARNLALRGGILLFLFWGTILGTVFIMPILFPEMDAASFFSTSMVRELPQPDYLKLYIPSNPFSSMALSMIPAVVLFALCIGVALIGIKEKKPLLNVLKVSKEALMKIARGVAYLTPVGVFSFAANAAGTLTVEQFAQLQVFFVTYMAIAVILTFILFPFLVSLFTPFSMREVISAARGALVTAFTTGNLFIVLPMITEKVKLLLSTRADKEDNENLPDIIIPVTFNFPDAGQLSFLSFILFASWFAGSQISVTRYPELGFTGLLSFFGGANLAIPYLLDSFKLSTDYFQLYMVAGIINGYFATMAASMQLVCFTLICSYWMSGKSHFSIKRLISNGSFSLIAMILIIAILKIYLAGTTNATMSQKGVLDGMKIKDPVEFTISKSKDTRSITEKIFERPNRANRLERIKENKILKVGFNPNTMPFAFYNSEHDLVGYDIQMAHNLARILEVDIEFIPFEMSDLDKSLKNNIFDIAMTGVYIGLNRIDKMDFTDSYMEINPAVIVKDYDKKRFHDVKSIQKGGKIHVAVLRGSLFTAGITKVFKDAQIVEIDNYKDFFDGKVNADMLVHSAEQGYTWTLLYPEYTVVILNELKHRTRVAYAIAKGDLPFLQYLNYWIQNMTLNKITVDNYKYWILGEVPELKKPRWCIARNVLHWID